MKTWLNAALKKEEKGWLDGGTPELIDGWLFSPLALDVIQVNRHLSRTFTAQKQVKVCSRCQAGMTMFLDDGQHLN